MILIKENVKRNEDEGETLAVAREPRQPRTLSLVKFKHHILNYYYLLKNTERKKEIER